MSKHFFVTGPPRSRTAWFANLFTWGDSVCSHEFGGFYCGDASHVGISDPALVLQWRKTISHCPKAKWVVIDRHFKDSLRSCQRIVPEITHESLMAFYLEIKGLISTVRPMVVEFESITPKVCFDVADYLGIDIGPEARVRQLCDMNIQVHPPVLQERLRALSVSTRVDAKEAA